MIYYIIWQYIYITIFLPLSLPLPLNPLFLSLSLTSQARAVYGDHAGAALRAPLQKLKETLLELEIDLVSNMEVDWAR